MKITTPSNPVGCAYNLAKFIVFILLAVHLGWSWWLLALLFVVVEVTFVARPLR